MCLVLDKYCAAVEDNHFSKKNDNKDAIDWGKKIRTQTQVARSHLRSKIKYSYCNTQIAVRRNTFMIESILI